MRVQDSHQGCEDQGLSEESESCDGDEEKVGEDDEEMSSCVLSHRPHQIEEDQVLENILLGLKYYLKNIFYKALPGERGEDIPGSSSEDTSPG